MAERMLVTEALNELKTLRSRIMRNISEASFVIGAKTKEKKVTSNVTKEEFKISAKASFDSVNDLIKRSELIKSLIVESNAKTYVEICGERMSIAKAIDLKNTIDFKKKLLDKLKADYSSALRNVAANNSQMEQKIDNLIQTSYGGKDKIKEEDYTAIVNPFRENNEYSLVDPLDIKKAIEDLEKYIEEFTATVDSKLQISNCTSYIEL